MDSDRIIHQELRIAGSIALDAPSASDIQERRLLTITDGSHEITIDVSVTATAMIGLGGRDPDDFIEQRILALATSLPNDGLKLETLEKQSPLTLDATHVAA